MKNSSRRTRVSNAKAIRFPTRRSMATCRARLRQGWYCRVAIAVAAARGVSQGRSDQELADSAWVFVDARGGVRHASPACDHSAPRSARHCTAQRSRRSDETVSRVRRRLAAATISRDVRPLGAGHDRGRNDERRRSRRSVLGFYPPIVRRVRSNVRAGRVLAAAVDAWLGFFSPLGTVRLFLPRQRDDKRRSADRSESQLRSRQLSRAARPARVSAVRRSIRRTRSFASA